MGIAAKPGERAFDLITVQVAWHLWGSVDRWLILFSQGIGNVCCKTPRLIFWLWFLFGWRQEVHVSNQLSQVKPTWSPGWSNETTERTHPGPNGMVSLCKPFLHSYTEKTELVYIQPASLYHMRSLVPLSHSTATIGNRNPGALKFSAFTHSLFSYLLLFYSFQNNIPPWLTQTPNGINLQILMKQISFWSIGQ